MSYTTVALVKAEAGLTSSGDDPVLETYIGQAQAWIERYTHRVFESTGNTTRRFTVGKDTYKNVLMLEDDLCSINAVVTNADAGSPQTISATEYTTIPRNYAPYYEIHIKGSSSKAWDYATDPEMGITVSGRWSYSLTAPADIARAATRLAAYWYRLKDSQVFDVTSVPGTGEMIIPKGVPADVKQTLDRYMKQI